MKKSKLLALFLALSVFSGCNSVSEAIETDETVVTPTSSASEMITTAAPEVITTDVETAPTEAVTEEAEASSIQFDEELYRSRVRLRVKERFSEEDLCNSETIFRFNDMENCTQDGKSMEEIISLLIDRNAVMYYTYYLIEGLYDEVHNDDSSVSVYHCLFNSYTDLSRFMYDTYTEELARNILEMPDCDMKPMFYGNDCSLMLNTESQGLSVYVTKFKDYTFEITSLTADTCEFTLYLPEDINNVTHHTAVLEENGWRLTAMFSNSPFSDEMNRKERVDRDWSGARAKSIDVFGNFNTEPGRDYNLISDIALKHSDIIKP